MSDEVSLPPLPSESASPSEIIAAVRALVMWAVAREPLSGGGETQKFVTAQVDGGVTLSDKGHIKGGQTDYNAGKGFFLGYVDGTYKFSIGSSSQSLTWDGSALTIKGKLTVQSGGTAPAVSGATMTGAGAIFNPSGTFALGNSTTNLSFNGTTMTMNGAWVGTANLAANAVTQSSAVGTTSTDYTFTAASEKNTGAVDVVTMTVVGGRVMVSGFIDITAYINTILCTIITIDANLYVDGVLSMHLANVQLPTLTYTGTAYALPSVAMSALVTGLSAGSRVFQWQVKANFYDSTGAARSGNGLVRTLGRMNVIEIKA